MVVKLEWCKDYLVTHKVKDLNRFVYVTEILKFARKIGKSKIEFWNEKTQKRTRLSISAISDIGEVNYD